MMYFTDKRFSDSSIYHMINIFVTFIGCRFIANYYVTKCKYARFLFTQLAHKL